jgi:hypothetical protein
MKAVVIYGHTDQVGPIMLLIVLICVSTLTMAE